jgi:hypothetical protein
MSQIIMLNHWLMMFLSPQSVRMDSKHFLAAEVLGLSSVNQPDKDIHGLSAAKHTLGLSVFNLNQPSKDVLSAVDQPHLDISAQENQYDPLCHGIEHSVGAQKSLKKDDNTAAAQDVKEVLVELDRTPVLQNVSPHNKDGKTKPSTLRSCKLLML